MRTSSDRFSFEEPLSPPRRKRASILVQALVFTPLAVLTGAGIVIALVSMISGNSGYIVMLVVSGLLFLVFAYQAVHFLRDVSAEPTTSEGEITRKWTKGNLFFFFMHSHYIAVKGQIYTIGRREYGSLLEEDMVRITHYPHSLTVEAIERYDETEKKFVPAEPSGPIY